MGQRVKPLAVVTGASTGIGYELAKCCAREGFDLVVAADEPRINTAAKDCEALGARVTAIEADLAMPEGVEKQIPHQDMADVIAFVKNWRYLDGVVPGVGGNSK